MKKIKHFLFLLAFFIPAVVPAQCCLAQWGHQQSYPRYLVLRTPVVRVGGESAPGNAYPGYVTPVTTNAYAYGWFGSTARPNGRTVSYGYYRNYTQWSNR